jgi:hypothetical protein
MLDDSHLLKPQASGLKAAWVSRERRLGDGAGTNSTAGLLGADGIFVATPPSR